MKKTVKFLSVLLCMMMILSVMPISAGAYSPYINDGTDGIKWTSVNITDASGNAVTSLSGAEQELSISARLKLADGTAEKNVQFLAAAYKSDGCLANAVLGSSAVLNSANKKADISFKFNTGSGASALKVFIWDELGSLRPVAEVADYNKGYTVKGFNINGTFYAADALPTEGIDIPAKETGYPVIDVLTDNPAAKVDINWNGTFPIATEDTYYRGKESESRDVKVTVSLGESRNEYTIKLNQDAPKVSNAKMAVYAPTADSAQTSSPVADSSYTVKWLTETTQRANSWNHIKIQQVKNSDTSEYKGALTLAALRENGTDALKAADTELKTAVGKTDGTNYPDGFMWARSDRTSMMLYDFSPILEGGTLMTFPVNKMIAKNLRNMNNETKALIGNTDDLANYDSSAVYNFIPITSSNVGKNQDLNGDVIRFDINRDATVYINTLTGNVPKAVTDRGFKRTDKGTNTVVYNGDQNGTKFGKSVLAYFLQTGGTVVNKGEGYWCEKDYEIESGAESKTVTLPAAGENYYVIVKFKDNSAVANAKYTTYATSNGAVDKNNTVDYDAPIYPYAHSAELYKSGAVENGKYTQSLHYVTAPLDAATAGGRESYGIVDISDGKDGRDDITGAEIIRLSWNNKSEKDGSSWLKKVEFDLTRPSTVWVFSNSNNPLALSDGWEKVASPIKSVALANDISAAKDATPRTTIKKTFNAEAGETEHVVLDMDALKLGDSFKNRVFVLVKPTELN